MATRIKTRTVGVLLFPDFEPLDDFGPMEAFLIAECPGSKPEDPRPRTAKAAGVVMRQDLSQTLRQRHAERT